MFYSDLKPGDMFVKKTATGTLKCSWFLVSIEHTRNRAGLARRYTWFYVYYHCGTTSRIIKEVINHANDVSIDCTVWLGRRPTIECGDATESGRINTESGGK